MAPQFDPVEANVIPMRERMVKEMKIAFIIDTENYLNFRKVVTRGVI